MKIISINIILLFTISNFSQTNENKIQSINNYTDSIDNAINNSIGYPGEIFCNTITTKRNVRAIGMQETKINFYFMQKEDSVYDDGNEVQFIPQYNPPLKIQTEYNIAASQMEYSSYYFDISGAIIYYLRISNGEYGTSKEYYWFDDMKLIKTEKYDANELKKKKDRTLKEKDFKEAEKINTKADIYITEYYNLFKIEILDK